MKKEDKNNKEKRQFSKSLLIQESILIWITTLMKLALQRIGDDSICIIDGDCRTQVDDISFAGVNNGMRRASKVFRDHDIYGEIELKQIHRSKIA